MFRIEARQQRAQVVHGDERHVCKADERRRGTPAGGKADARTKRLRKSPLGLRVRYDLETECIEPARKLAVSAATHGNPAPRLQRDDPPRRVEGDRIAIQFRKQLVARAEPPRLPRSEQYGGDIGGLDHDGILPVQFSRRSPWRARYSQRATAMIASAPADILRFILSRTDERLNTVLVTLTGIEGVSSRAIGAQMAIAEDGQYVGSFSGGCVEAAVVAEALGTLASGNAKLVRFGAGSPYLDIRLPCGGGIDLLFNPRPDPQAIADIVALLDARKMATLRLSRTGLTMADAAAPQPGWQDDSFDISYLPRLRIVAIGQGEDLTGLARLAHGFGADVAALTPDRRALAELTARGIDTIELLTRTTLPPVHTDAWTAIVFLFHDRDWEEGLLPQAVHLPGFYFGAVGSRRTHATRLERLRIAGIPEHLLDTLRGPIGLIPATRDPATLALSILSEIVQDYNRIASSGHQPAAEQDDTSRRSLAPALRPDAR